MRKSKAEKRIPIPDPIYRSRLVSRTINNIMQDGKKDLAQRILYLSFEAIRAKMDEEPLKIFNKAIENIVPSLELKVRRIGGANYQIPVEVSDDRKTTLALRWLIHFARLRNEKTMVKRLAGEIIDASKGIGASVKKRDDTHKMAEANKAFAHYRW